MQEFLTNNTVNCNLMSLTGYRTLVLLNILMESPKSIEEINEHFLNNQYIKEKFSIDTIRFYINSLRASGCEITRANKSNGNKYELISHPFDFDIPKFQLKAISKLYKAIYDKIEIKELIAIHNLFSKIASYIKNDKTKEYMKNHSMLKNVDIKILNELIVHCKNKNQITFLYKSPKSKEKEIEIIADKLSFKSEKLYLWGQSITHREYAYFRLDRILKVFAIKIKKDEQVLEKPNYFFELRNQINYIPEENEKILEQTDDRLVIEAVFENRFSAIQKILYHGEDCRIISPNSLKDEIFNTLKNMKEAYN